MCVCVIQMHVRSCHGNSDVDTITCVLSEIVSLLQFQHMKRFTYIKRQEVRLVENFSDLCCQWTGDYVDNVSVTDRNRTEEGGIGEGVQLCSSFEHPSKSRRCTLLESQRSRKGLLYIVHAHSRMVL